MRAIMLPRAVAIFAAFTLTGACAEPFSVPPNEPSTGTLSLVPRSATIEAGEVFRFTADLRDEFGNSIQTVMKWTSSNDAVATVSSNGEVLGRMAGHAVITSSALGKYQSSAVRVLARAGKHDPGGVQ